MRERNRAVVRDELAHERRHPAWHRGLDVLLTIERTETEWAMVVNDETGRVATAYRLPVAVEIRPAHAPSHVDERRRPMVLDVDRIESVERVVQVLGFEGLGAHDETGGVELEDDDHLDDVGSERHDRPPERNVVSTNCEHLGRDGPPAGDDRPDDFDVVGSSDRFLHLQTLVLPPDESRVQHCDVAIEVAVVHRRGPRLERSRRIVGDHATVRRVRIRELVVATPSVVEAVDREQLLADDSAGSVAR